MAGGPTYNGDIRSLATIGTPHYGIPINFQSFTDSQWGTLWYILTALHVAGSTLQPLEMYYGSDFLTRLHDLWSTLQNGPFALPNTSMLFIAGTYNDDCTGPPDSLFLIPNVPCNDGLVDVNSAIVPSVLPKTGPAGFVRYIPYKHCDNCNTGPTDEFLTPAEANVSNAMHKTYSIINPWLFSGTPPDQGCGSGGAITLNYCPGFWSSPNEGMIVLRARDPNTSFTPPTLSKISYSLPPAVNPALSINGSASTGQTTITITQVPAPATYTITLSFAGYQPVEVTVMVPALGPVVPDTILLTRQ